MRRMRNCLRSEHRITALALPGSQNRFQKWLGTRSSARTSASSIASSIEIARPVSQNFVNCSAPGCSMKVCSIRSLRTGVTPKSDRSKVGAIAVFGP